MSPTTATTTQPSLGKAAALQRVRERRERLRWTRVQLAQRSGVSLAHLGNIEQGSLPKRSDAANRILAVLDEAERGA